MNSEGIRQLQACFGEVSLHGKNGTETQMAAMDSLLHSWKHGASLDYSHCFDTVSLTLLQRALPDALPPPLRTWINLVLQQWITSRRWIVYDGLVHVSPYEAPFGLPQGDGASALVLGLLLSLGHSQVQKLAGKAKVHQLIYMDDRTIITNCKDTLGQALEVWKRFSKRFHLLENEDKLQICDLNEGPVKHLEVLGGLIGAVTKKQLLDFEKGKKRNKQARQVLWRIKKLPMAMNGRAQQMGCYAKTKAVYGWISGPPPLDHIKSYNQAIWKSMGKFGCAVPHLRSLICGCHLQLFEAWLLRFLRVFVKANEQVQKLREDFCAPLRLAIYDALDHFGWSLTMGKWVHVALPHEFTMEQTKDEKTWKLISHNLRQSMRWKYYTDLNGSSRREFRYAELPPFDEQRVDLVRQWIRKKGGKTMLCAGAIPSLALLSKMDKKYTHLHCERCGFPC
eukprot:s5354_g5.t1